MNQELNIEPTKIENFVKIAQIGHYPLFFDDWLSSSLKEKKSLTFMNASKNVKAVFTNLERHRTIEKKKTALIGMEKESREEFIRSFFKVVEHEMLKDLKTLQ
jgi:hypothetical protein